MTCWNRVRTMTYPDGELVTYHYNAAGRVEDLSSNKLEKEYVIVNKVGYDKEGHSVYTKLGNGSEARYTYYKQRELLQNMTLTAKGSSIMDNKYSYDAVDNILFITNATYDMAMSFGRMSEPLTKVQSVDKSSTARSYNLAYKYEDERHPTAPTLIGHEHYTYDENGNPVLVNGTPQVITFHKTDGFNNTYGVNGSNVTAGQQDYAERMNQIESQREDYYRAAGVAPGLPTMKGSYADPEDTGVGYNVLIKELGDHSVPAEWVQHPSVNTESGSNPGAPIGWNAPENPDEAVAGYGYIGIEV